MKSNMIKMMALGGALGGGILIGAQMYQSKLEQINTGIEGITIEAMEQAHDKGTTKKQLIKAQEKIQQLEATLKQSVSEEDANNRIQEANAQVNLANGEELEVLQNITDSKQALDEYIKKVDKASQIGGGELPSRPNGDDSHDEGLGDDLEKPQEENEDLSPQLPPSIGDDNRDESDSGAERPERPTERPTETPQGLQ